jgi:mono/diheme cytochrome c family protein
MRLPRNSLRFLSRGLLLCLLLTFSRTAAAAPASTAAVEPELWDPFPAQFPYQTSCVSAPYPAGNTAHKSVSMRLGPGAAMNFDTDLLRMATGWTGAFLTPNGVAFDTSHGGHPQVAGDVKFGTRPGPGWADAQGRFDDPRKPQPYGPLPESWARWDGLYVVDQAVVLAYTVLGTKVHEQPSAITRDGRTVFARTFDLGAAKQPLGLLVADVDGYAGQPQAATGAGPLRVTAAAGERVTTAVVPDAPAGSRLELLAGGRVVLRLPKGKPAGPLHVLVYNAHKGDTAAYGALVKEAATATIVAYRKGGAPHFPKPIVTKGERGAGPGPYVVDRLTTPFAGSYYRGEIADWKDNAYKRRMMLAGLDFFSDGKRAAVSTWEGDVWIVEGIDDSLDRLVWRRFASGGYETLGLKIVNDVIYTSGRDQITRYHDLNGDGEADHYENFNNQVTSSTGFHEFQFDLHTDKQGNFYTAKAGPVRSGGRGFGGGGGNGEVTAFSGTVQKISKDGKRREVYATGLRAPNGIGVSPDGQVTTGDNEGSWVPACPINWVSPGSFHGVEDLVKSPAPKFRPPLMWISKSYDNSGGSQVWVDSDRWGPWKGELLHLSYGRASVYVVLKQKAGDLMQGGIVRLVGGSDAVQLSGQAQKLTSSAMRGRFNPRDGQLYVVGLAGWQTDAVQVTGFDRIRYTGKPVYSVKGLEVTSAGVKLTFSHPLDPGSVSPQNVSGERWNYKRTSAYGSPEFSVSEPETRGHDRLEVLATTLSEDGRTITVAIDDLRPADQMLLKFKVKAQDGTPIVQTVMHTVHVVPKDPNAKTFEGVARRTKPGLELTVEGGGARDVSLVDGVALFVSAGRSASPLLPPGRFQATWTGMLSPELPAPRVFTAALRGKVRVTVAGRVVLEANGNGAEVRGAAVPVDKGENPFEVVFTAPDGGDAFLRLGWKDDKAGPVDPIPAAYLRQPAQSGRATADLVRRGRELYLEHRCVRCHADGVPSGAPELAMDAPAFDGIGARRTLRWMTEWIRNPRGARADARMPALLHGPAADEEARAMATYLASLGATTKAKGTTETAPPIAGDPAKGESLWTDLNCGGCHSPMLQMLSEDGKLALMHVGSKFAPGALAAFLRAPERHFAWTRMPNFHLTAAEADDLAAYLLSNVNGRPAPTPPAAPEVLARGKALVQTTGCLACHDGKGIGLANKLPAVDLGRRLAGGGGKNGRSCVDGNEPAAHFGFGAADKVALKAFLGAPQALASLARHAPIEFAARQTRALGCAACHGQMEGFPALEGLGGKLRPEWTSAFIAGQLPYKPRPAAHADGHVWLPARMPAFASRAALLAEGLAAAHGVPPRTPAEPPVDAAAAKLGETLVSANGGFACVTCHAVGPSTATQVFETEGINLAYAHERLLPAFFRRWLRNPLAVDPQTKMPVYFDEDGRSPVETILGGDGDKQIEALWHYLRQVGRGPGATAKGPIGKGPPRAGR